MLKNIFNNISDKELLLHTVISFLIRILSAVSMLLISVLIGQTLGATDAGYYFLTFSIVTVCASFSRVGFDNALVRFIGSDFPEGNWSSVKTVISWGLLFSTIVSGLISCFVWFNSDWIAVFVFDKPELSLVLKAASPAILALALCTILSQSLLGLRKVAMSIVILNIAANVTLAVLIVLVSLRDSESIAWAFTFSSFSALSLGIFFIWKVFTKSGGRKIHFSEIVNSCLPLWIVIIMTQLTQWSGQFIAGAWVDSDQLAQLAVAQRTAMLTSFILMTVNMVVAPRFASLYKKKDFAGLEKMAINSVRLTVFLALPIVVIMLIFPRFFMSLFGDGFEGGAYLLQVLVVGQFVNVITGSVGILLSMSGYERDLRNTVLISGTCAVLLAFILVPLFGVIGSAIATSVAIAIQNLVAVWKVKTRLGFNTLNLWGRF